MPKPGTRPTHLVTDRERVEMTYLVTENCIRCKYQDCVSVCPVDCFYAGDPMLVINPDECIDCGVCVPECPADAIVADDEDEGGYWLEVNTRFARQWPNITEAGAVPADADAWNGKANKREVLTEHG